MSLFGFNASKNPPTLTATESANLSSATIDNLTITSSLTVDGSSLLEGGIISTGNNVFSGQNQFDNLSFSNVSSSIAIVNGDFQLPLEPTSPYNFYPLATGGTYPPNDPYLIGQGFTGWGISGTYTQMGIQVGGGDSTSSSHFYLGPPPVGQQIVVIEGTNPILTSQNYLLSSGTYTLTYQLCSGRMTGSMVTNVVNATTSTIIASSLPTNVVPEYANYVTFTLTFIISSPDYYNINFTVTTGSTLDFVAIYVKSLFLENSIIVTDGTNTATIGGSESILNDLYVNNGLTVNSGGANITGEVQMTTAHGVNNLAINSLLGSSNSSTDQNVIAIGVGALQASTSSSSVVAIGNGVINSVSSAKNVVAIGGSAGNTVHDISNCALIGYGVGCNSGQQNNVIMGYSIGGGVGSFNVAIGSNQFQYFNGFGSTNPSYCVAIGDQSQQNSADNYNTSVGCNSLQLINGGGIYSSYNTRYNTALGYGSGASQYHINNCTFLGANADASAANVSNMTCVGYGTKCGTSNTIQLGSNSETVAMSGNLQIGSTTITPSSFSALSYLYYDASNNVGYGSSIYPSTKSGSFNSFFGNGVGSVITSGGNNVGVGYTALKNLTAGSNNVAVGAGAGYNITTGVQNVMMGTNAGQLITNANYNVMIGQSAGSNTSGSSSTNVLVGYQSGQNISGNNNVVLGYSAGPLLSSDNNIVIGTNAMQNAISGTDNIIIGRNSAAKVQNASTYNTFIGQATDANTLGSYNFSTALGAGATVTGNHQVVLGTTNETVYAPAALNVGSSLSVGTSLGVGTSLNVGTTFTLGSNLISGTNTVTPTQLGYLASTVGGICDLSSNQTIGGSKTLTNTLTTAPGTNMIWTYDASSRITIMNPSNYGLIRFNHDNFSVGIGYNALSNEGSNKSSNNTAIGENALSNPVNVRYCTAVGGNALQNCTSNGASQFTENTGVGYNALNKVTSGTGNTGIGYNSGITLTTGTNCTFIGTGADASLNNLTQSCAIGYGALAFANNQIVFGTLAETIYIPGLLQVSNQYVHSSSATIQVASFTISAPFYEIYPVAPSGANITITLPAASAAYLGVRFTVRRVAGTATNTVSSASSNILPTNSFTASSTILAAGSYTANICCTIIASTPTYSWCIV